MQWGYPVNLNISEKKVLIVGGGKVAVRKARRLLECGAKIKVVSLSIDEFFIDKAELCFKAYDKEDLTEIFLVLAASDNIEVNKQVLEDAKSLGILCGAVDSNWSNGDFYGVAWEKNEEVSVTVSVADRNLYLSKLLAGHLKQHLDFLNEEIWVIIKVKNFSLDKVLLLLGGMFGVYESFIYGNFIKAKVSQSAKLLELLKVFGDLEIEDKDNA